MRTLLGWVVKLSVVGMLYVGMASGVKVKLPDTILGYKVPDSAKQWVDRNSQIADIGRQTQDGFKNIGSAFK